MTVLLESLTLAWRTCLYYLLQCLPLMCLRVIDLLIPGANENVLHASIGLKCSASDIISSYEFVFKETFFIDSFKLSPELKLRTFVEMVNIASWLLSSWLYSILFYNIINSNLITKYGYSLIEGTRRKTHSNEQNSDSFGKRKSFNLQMNRSNNFGIGFIFIKLS